MNTFKLVTMTGLCCLTLLAGCDADAAKQKAAEEAKKAAENAQQHASALAEKHRPTADALTAKARDEARKQLIKRIGDDPEALQIVTVTEQFVRAVSGRDLIELKKLCTDSDSAEYTAVMGCYYEAFRQEDTEGPDAARAYLAAEQARDDCPPHRREALKVLDDYMGAKGSLRTRELAGLILIIGLECKYPHRGGMAGKMAADALGLAPAGGWDNAPATATTAPEN
jgi:hypothetical protein